MSLRGKAAIVGAALAGCGEAHGRTSMDITIEAVHGALADAGVKLSEVDAIATCQPLDLLSGLTLVQELGIAPKFTMNNRMGGSSFLSHTMWAAMLLETGLAETVVICYGSNQRTASGKLMTAIGLPTYEAPYKPMFPLSSYALAADRHMHQFGTTREQLADVAVAARGWAQKNPEAFVRDPLTREDVIASRLISDPLRVRDCCLVTDGGAALVMRRAEVAVDHPQPPVYFLGGGEGTTHRDISEMADLTVTGAAQSGAAAMAMAGVSAADIDVVQLYDAFTINVILFLEDLGFCKKGEGGAFVQGGRIAPGGELPVNTNGGGLSCVHPGMYGMFTLVEAVRQLRGQTGERQIEGAELALCHGNGGVLSSQVTNILGTSATL
ncbi:MAG: thiolase [Marinosulfonomonas sp.]|nr:thiolase [Marinosulfonomonas sp.]